jgi:hypothetical protein
LVLAVFTGDIGPCELSWRLRLRGLAGYQGNR